ncbi:MAG TPA: hypothetical protein VM889_04005 [Candidatus Thermoplasmatota archaeon]|nr:hypothetical protein [Candidatus Thermoplasmatota archaeon]
MRGLPVVLLALVLAFSGCLGAVAMNPIESASDEPSKTFAYRYRINTSSAAPRTGFHEMRFVATEPSELTVTATKSDTTGGGSSGTVFFLIRSDAAWPDVFAGGGGFTVDHARVRERVGPADVNVGCCPIPVGGRGNGTIASDYVLAAGESVSLFMVVRNVTKFGVVVEAAGRGAIEVVEQKGAGAKFADIPIGEHGNATYVRTLGDPVVLRAGPVTYVADVTEPGVFSFAAQRPPDAAPFTVSLALPNGTTYDFEVGARPFMVSLWGRTDPGRFTITYTPKDPEPSSFPVVRWMFVPAMA